MKRKSISMIFVALLCFCVLPIINFANGRLSFDNKDSTLASLRAEAFKLDSALGVFNAVASHIGYSTSPRQALIGREGWLYLGDEYADSVSAKRGQLLPPPENFDIYRARRHYLDATAKQYGARGVSFFIAPNKEDIYQEHYPVWATTQAPTFFDVLQARNEPDLHDLRHALLQAKQSADMPLYYRTDSHWNDMGAWIAYREIMHTLNRDGHALSSLADHDISVSYPTRQPGGDIAAFLFASRYLPEPIPVVSIPRQASAPLNALRVMWLRDSFGTALSGYMNHTFNIVAQIHPAEVLHDNQRYTSLLQEHRPDLVLVTIVGRSYRENVMKANELAKTF